MATSYLLMLITNENGTKAESFLPLFLPSFLTYLLNDLLTDSLTLPELSFDPL